MEGTFKDGKETYSYEYDLDGTLIRQDCWDEDGNERDCN